MSEKFTRDEIIRRVGEAIEPCNGTLITIAGDGFPQARVLEDHNPYEGFAFWFATHSRTRKVAEIQAHPEVCVLYQPPDVGGYICIMGEARIRTDEEGRRYIWRDEWSQYYSGPMAPEYVPIQITARRIEYYDSKVGAVAADGFGPVVVDL